MVIHSLSWDRGSDLPTGGVTGSVPDPPTGGWVWVDLADEDKATITTVCRGFGIDPALVADAMVEDSLPMLEERRELIYLVLNGFRTGSEQRLVTSDIRIFAGADFLMTIHGGEVASISATRERLEQGISLPVPGPTGLLAYWAMVASRRVPALIDQLEVKVDALEELAMRADPRAITEVHALRRDVVILRRVLVPQRQIYSDLSEGSHPLVDEASQAALERVGDYQGRLLESLEGARSLLGSVLETHRGAMADQTNEIVRVLTVFSAILLPLGLVAGIFGMNLAGMPLSEDRDGFWLILGAMAVGALALWVYFARRGFVGGPRLRDLPRAVGLGLFNLGVAPIKAVAEGIDTTIRYVSGAEAGADADQSEPRDA